MDLKSYRKFMIKIKRKGRLYLQPAKNKCLIRLIAPLDKWLAPGLELRHVVVP
jgi:hypothetical protein